MLNVNGTSYLHGVLILHVHDLHCVIQRVTFVSHAVGGRTASAIIDQSFSELRSLANERLGGKKSGGGGGGGGGGKVNVTEFIVELLS